MSNNHRIVEVPAVGYGPAKPADTEALAKDAVGFTNPNLHRRIDPQELSAEQIAQGELDRRKYSVGIYGESSYRTTHMIVHDEDSDVDEIP